MKRCSFLGAGNMASAIVGGIAGQDICLYDVNASQYEKFKGIPFRIAADPSEAVAWGDYIFLCVKPQNFTELLTALKDSGVSLDGKVFVSIAAGISTASVCRDLGKEVAVIRTMPNTPLLIGQGVTALSRNALVSDSDFEAVQALFASCGDTFPLCEDRMNAVIAATSSAPAYVYLLIEAIVREAENQGVAVCDLTEKVASMVSGAAQMVLRTQKSPAELIAMVKSPKGTTEQALLSLEKDGFCEIIARAMQACTARAEELGK